MSAWRKLREIYEARKARADQNLDRHMQRARHVLGERRMSRYANVLAWSLILGFFAGPALGLSGPDLSKTRDLLFTVACITPFATACYVLLRVDIASHRGWISFPLLLSWLMVPAWAGLFLYLDANDIWDGDSVRETVLRLSAFAAPIVLFFLARRQASKREPLQPLEPPAP